MIDEKVVSDLKDSSDSILQVKTLLNQLYYNNEFSTVFNRPVLSMLMIACDYLSSNLNELSTKYVIGKG